jgi:PAP2 superfamily
VSLLRPQTLRFAGFELGLWAGLYAAYLALRDVSIAQPDVAFRHASTLVDVERAAGLFHEARLQSALDWGHAFFSAYYMVAFGPLLAATLVWLGLRRRDHYRELRTLLLLSLGIVGAVVALTAVALVAAIRRARPRREAEVIRLRPRQEALEDARRAA